MYTDPRTVESEAKKKSEEKKCIGGLNECDRGAAVCEVSKERKEWPRKMN